MDFMNALQKAQRYDFLYSNSAVLAAGTPGAINQMEIKTNQDSFYVIQTLQALAVGGNAYSVRISDDGTGLLWQSGRVNAANVFGTAQRPNILIWPIIVPPTSRIQLALADESGAGDTVEVVCGGYRVYANQLLPKNSKRIDQWFQYVESKAILANATDTFNIKLQADSYFQVQKIMAVSTGIFQARLSDTATGKTWSDRFIRNANQFGTAQRPRVLPMPKLLDPNTTVQCEVTDLSGSGNTVEIVLEGTKKYSLEG